MNLECSSKGDKRYSSMYAKITVFDKYDTIENHYQLSKVFIYNGVEVYPKTPKEAKRMQFSKYFTLIGFKVNGILYSVEYLSVWYKSLWYKYLYCNKHLIDNARQYSTFTDCFRNKNTVNCQADVVHQVVTRGLGSLYNDCIGFFNMIRAGGK